MTKFLLTILFAVLWLATLASASAHMSLSPPVSNSLYGPVAWQVKSRSISPPLFLLHGQAAGQSVTVKTNALDWALASTRQTRLYADNRTFLTDSDVARDRGMTLSIGPMRFDAAFPFWALLTVLLPFFFRNGVAHAAPRVESPSARWQRDEAFRQNVRDLEIDYAGRPHDLRRRTVLLAALGYGVILLVAGTFITLAATVAHIAVMLTQHETAALAGLVPLWFAVQLLRPLNLKRGGDSGVRLMPADAPRLFKLLGHVRKKGRGPAFARVFINMDLNASVSRHTGWRGFFGFGPVTLTLGLPLMQALSEAQLAAVIGHEYGHVAAEDNALGQWIYRIRHSWLDLEKSLKNETLWHVLRLDRFYAWFIGVFNAYSFTLSRACEFEADAFAARVVSARHIAGALTAMEAVALRLHDEFWAPIWRQADTSPLPAGAPYQEMPGFFRRAPARDPLPQLKRRKTASGSTHPALADRAAALKEELFPPQPVTASSATKTLGPALESHLAALFDRVWREHSRKEWAARHRQRQDAAAVLATLGAHKPPLLADGELFTLIDAALLMKDETKAMAACEALIKRAPDNASARALFFGLRLTHDRDETALHELDDLVRVHPSVLPTASRFAAQYLESEDRPAEAEVYRFRLEDWSYRQKAADEERRAVYPGDRFAPHHLKTEYLRQLILILKQEPDVAAAWVARKDVTYMPEQPHFVIGLQPVLWPTQDRRRTRRKLMRALDAAHLPSVFRFFWLDETHGLARKLKRIDGAKFYTK